MNDRPELITRVSHDRVEALREVAARRRSVAAARGDVQVAGWRLHSAALLRSLANRLAPVAQSASRAVGSRPGSAVTPGGSEPC